jgi:hypothetical protein
MILFKFIFLCTFLVDKSWCIIAASNNKLLVTKKAAVLKESDSKNSEGSTKSENKNQDEVKR